MAEVMKNIIFMKVV
jgi:hypothetical protein